MLDSLFNKVADLFFIEHLRTTASELVLTVYLVSTFPCNQSKTWYSSIVIIYFLLLTLLLVTRYFLFHTRYCQL